MKESSRKALKMTASILLAVCVLSCSFSVFATDSTPAPTPELDDGLGAVTDELMSRYIWLCLRAWGINIEYGDMDTFYDAVENQIVDWVIQYLASLPSAVTINQWIAPWQADFDYWGNLRLNSSALEDIQDFGSWLIGEYDLTDNTDTSLNPIYALDNLTLYNMNQYYTAVRADNNEIGMYVKVAAEGYNGANVDGVYYFVAKVNGTLYFVFVADRQVSTAAVMTYGMLVNGETEGRSVTTISFYSSNLNVNGVYQNSSMKINAPNGTGSYSNVRFIPQNAVVGVFANNTDLTNFLSTSDLKIDKDGSIITTTIVLPSDSPTYTDGDGMTIIDGEPQYQVVVIDSVTVENLPAIIQPSSIDNPEIDQFYDFIPSFIEEAGDSMNFFKQIIFRMPDEVLYCIYAVLASGVIFGFLRILREH